MLSIEDMIPHSLWACVKYTILCYNNKLRKKTWEGSKENGLFKNQWYQLLKLFFSFIFIIIGYNLNFLLTRQSKTNRVDRQRKERITELRIFQRSSHSPLILLHVCSQILNLLFFFKWGWSIFTALLRNVQTWYYIEYCFLLSRFKSQMMYILRVWCHLLNTNLEQKKNI